MAGCGGSVDGGPWSRAHHLRACAKGVETCVADLTLCNNISAQVQQNYLRDHVQAGYCDLCGLADLQIHDFLRGSLSVR